jgi:hypothetical protein
VRWLGWLGRIEVLNFVTMLDVWQFHNEKAKIAADENETGKLPHWTFSISAEVPSGQGG